MMWERRGLKDGLDVAVLGNRKKDVAVFQSRKGLWEDRCGVGGGTEREDQEFGFTHSRSDMPVNVHVGLSSPGVARVWILLCTESQETG